jgi:hypothetical protein
MQEKAWSTELSQNLKIKTNQEKQKASQACCICPMSLRPRRDGLRVFTHIRAITRAPCPSARPHVLWCASTPATCRPQRRILQTCSNTKGAQYPRTSALPIPINWSSTVHRIRHISPSAMTGSEQTRSHAGHSHHHHHHDNTFLLSKNKSDAGVRITRIGLYVNLGMAVSKGFGGYVFNSQGEYTGLACEQQKSRGC